METQQEALKIEADIARSAAQQDKAHALSLEIRDADGYRLATETLKALTAKHRELEERRKSATRPLDEAKKQIMAWFRPAVDELAAALHVLRRAMGEYTHAQNLLQQKAVAAYGQALSEGRTPDKAALVQAFEGAPAPVAGTQTRTVWKFEIVDEAALPRAFMIADEKRIGEIVRQEKDQTNIPGVRVFAETVVVVKGNGENHE
jgi:Rad3-related DNA helicase